MSELAVTKKMWERRRVHGWAFTDELPSSGTRVETLVSLARAGWVWREAARDPFRKLPLSIHRITQAGQHVLTFGKGLPRITIPRQPTL